MNTVRFNSNKTLVIAHRGLSGIETENTNSAFVAAGNRSYFGIETDVHVTADGKFVVIHDDVTVRVSEEVINVEESTFEKVRSIRLKNICNTDKEGICKNDEREDIIIPSLAEYIGICRKYEKMCVLELKKRFKTEDIVNLIAEIKELQYLENMIFISFDLNNMKDIRSILPEAELQYLVKDFEPDVLKLMNEYSLDLDIKYNFLTKEIVDDIHANGHKVNCWTCDSKEDAERLVSWGVDFITTNILE